MLRSCLCFLMNNNLHKPYRSLFKLFYLFLEQDNSEFDLGWTDPNFALSEDFYKEGNAVGFHVSASVCDCIVSLAEAG